MDFAAMMTPGSQILVIILFVLTMMLRSSKNIPNWIIQWIVLVVALLLSYLQTKAVNIDTIMNAFVATGICTFGENAIFRKSGEKTKSDCNILKVVNAYQNELSSTSQGNSKVKDICSSDLDEDEIKSIIDKIIEEKINK